MNVLLLDLSQTPGDFQLVFASSFTNRILHCTDLSQNQISVYYPGASKTFLKPLQPYPVLIKAYQIPRPKCTHYLIAGDARIHAFVNQQSQIWIGFTTLFNNLLFKKILDLNLWCFPVISYKQQVKLKSSRIDFLLNSTHYLQIKADFVLWFNLKNSRFLKHLTLLNTLDQSSLVFIAPYSKSSSALYNPNYIQSLKVLKTFSNVSFYWVYVSYDKFGKVWFNSLEKLS